MTDLRFDMLSPFIGDCHPAAGVAGLVLALESLPKNQTLIAWERDRTSLKIEGDLTEALDYLIRSTFQLKNGVIRIPGSAGSAPALTHYGFLETLLQVPATRTMREKHTIMLRSKYGDVAYPVLLLESFIHQSFASKLLKGKEQKLVDKVETTSWLIPNSSAGMFASIEVAIAALFSPLTWGFYQIQEPIGSGKVQKLRYSTALICPVITNLDRVDFAKPLSPEEFVTGSLADACLHFANANGCCVHGFQYYSESANRVAKIIKAENCKANPDYLELLKNFPNAGGLKENGSAVIFANVVRGLAATNIAHNRRWYEGISELDFEALRSQKLGLQSQLGVTRQERWKQKTGFESSDRRRGYKAGNAAAKRGKTLPSDLPDSEWGQGYRRGFEAALSDGN